MDASRNGFGDRLEIPELRILRGEASRGEVYSIAISNGYQQVDSGTEMIHLGKNTSSRLPPLPGASPCRWRVQDELSLSRAATTNRYIPSLSKAMPLVSVHLGPFSLENETMDIPAQTKPAVWGAIAGAIATLILGFYFGGWYTASSADQMANERSEKKVISALAPFCVDRFLKSADAAQSAELLKFTTDYERGSFLEKGGWTSLPGSKETNWGVGRACGDLLAAVTKK